MAERAHLSSERQKGERPCSRQPDARPGGTLVRAWPIFSLAALCCLSTMAGVGAAIWIDRLGPAAIRMPASEPGRSLFAPSGRSGGAFARGPGLPMYQPGDSFEFKVREPSSAGEPIAIERRFQVDSVKADRIEWSVGRNAAMTTTLNPLAPALSWRAMEEGEGSRQLLGDPLALFPLEKGKKASVRSIGGANATSFRDTWECEAAGQEQVTVAAGTFRSWRIECASQSGSEKETYYYSDEVGFWVSRLSKMQRGSESIERVYELVASSRLRRP